jgi:Zn-dependent protease
MLPTPRGSIRLFRFAGIDVYLHWWWFAVALIELQNRKNLYSSLVWNVAEYLSLFAIVLMHEFGHSLACRSVGGEANQIILWPLGGVAFVAPPQRPGATLWSIAAGPLVNVVLVFVFAGIGVALRASGIDLPPDVLRYFRALTYINLGLLIFNMLPVYPLDGGQVLRSLLWFLIGRARSLLVASAVGVLGGLAMLVLAIYQESFWFGLLGFFMLSRSAASFKLARVLRTAENAPRHDDFACPSCGIAPMRGALWVCPQCKTQFDTFDTGAVCPKCGAQFPTTRCTDCSALHPITEWKKVV